MELKIDSIIDALKSPLGIIDNPERRSQIEDYIEAARLPLERAVFDLLSQFAESVNDEVSAHYQVTLSYRAGVLDLAVQAAEADEPDGAAWSLADGEVEKITLRIPAELKGLAAEAASQASLSANSWVIKTLSRHLRKGDALALERGLRRRGRRHSGASTPSGRTAGQPASALARTRRATRPRGRSATTAPSPPPGRRPISATLRWRGIRMMRAMPGSSAVRSSCRWSGGAFRW